jgi:hypothetical protein
MAHEDPRLMTGLFPDRTSAERAYGSLTERGYTKDDVSLLMSQDSRERYFPKNDPARTELGTRATEGAAVGAVTGGGLGALLAGLAASGIAVPGLPIIAMGALAAALVGAGTGGGIGAIIGALVGHGIPKERAEQYDAGIRRGGIVMGVTPRTREDAEYLEREWAACGGEQIYCPTWRARDAA